MSTEREWEHNKDFNFYLRDWMRVKNQNFVPVGHEIKQICLSVTCVFDDRCDSSKEHEHHVIAVPAGTTKPDAFESYKWDPSDSWYAWDDDEADLTSAEVAIRILDGIRAVIWVEKLNSWVLPTQAWADWEIENMVRYSTIRLKES